MGVSIGTLNPTETIRSVVLDPMAPINHGMSVFSAFNLTGLQVGAMAERVGARRTPVASAVNLGPQGGAPGRLSATLRVRDPRRHAGRTDRQLFSAIDGGRKRSAEWPHRTVSVNVSKRLDGSFAQSQKLAENALDPDLELDNFATAANDHNVDLNTYFIDRMTRLAGDTASQEAALTAAGWRTLDWDASYTAIDSSESFAEDFHKVIAGFRLGAFGRRPNVLYCSQSDFEKFQRDPSLRGMLIRGDSTAGVAAVNVTTETLAPQHVEMVFAQHFGLTVKTESTVYDSAARSAGSGTYSYNWTAGRMWLGVEGPTEVRGISNGEPQVSRAGGAFALFHNGLGETGITEEGEGIVTHRVYAIQSFVDIVPIIPEWGMIIYDLNG